MTGPYSQFKVVHHPEQLKVLREGRIPRPIHVQLIISDLCQQSCHFCAYRMERWLSNELFVGKSLRAAFGENNPIRRIPTAKALEIVQDCAELGVKAIQFTGGGEPTIHPDHLRIFGLAQNYKMDTGLVTNGVKMDPYHSSIQRMTWIRVSVDAGNQGTYAQVRRCPSGHWDRMWKNVAMLARSDYAGTLGIGFVATPENYLGIEAAAQRAKDVGVESMRVGAVFSKEGSNFYSKVPKIIPRICNEISLAKEKLDGDGFEIIDLFSRRIGELDSGSPKDPMCYYQMLTVYIGGDLNVYRCCNTAFTTAGLVGSLKETSFRKLVRTYLPFDARSCRFCQFIGQNEVLKALVEEPEHVNFV